MKANRLQKGPKLFLLPLLAVFLSACGGLSLFPKPPVELASPALLELLPGGSGEVRVRLLPEGKGAQVELRMADPCANGRASCPGWDASRYPGVEHTREAFTLTPTNLEARFTFTVAPDALPQGPFKWEVVARDTEGKEWTFPVYLRIRDGGRSALEALAEWRRRAGLPGVEEDPEWSFRGWLHSRYAVKNYPNNLVHDEDLSQPFATPEGREAGKIGNEWLYFYYWNDPYRPSDQAPVNSPVNGWIATPFHRFNLVYPWPLRVGHGRYRDVGPVSGYPGVYSRSGANLPNLSPWTADSPVQEVLFPSPGMVLPLAHYGGWENPDPTAPCQEPGRSPKRPFLTQEGLTWHDGTGWARNPIGFPVTVMTFAWKDTEVLEARVVRLSDGEANPVCAYGSLQYWEEREFWRGVGVTLLRAHGALIVLPHRPLTPGREYEVFLKARVGGEERTWTWRFQVQEGDLWSLD